MREPGTKNLKKLIVITWLMVLSLYPVSAITAEKNNFLDIKSSTFSWRNVSSKTFRFAHTLPQQISKYVLSTLLMVTPVLGYTPKPMGGYITEHSLIINK